MDESAGQGSINHSTGVHSEYIGALRVLPSGGEVAFVSTGDYSDFHRGRESVSCCGNGGLGTILTGALVDPVGFAGHEKLFQGTFGVSIVTSYFIRIKLWDGNGGENSDDGDDDEQFDQCECFLVLIRHGSRSLQEIF